MPSLVLRTSRLPMILIWTLYFHGLVIVLDASFTCKAGQRVARRKAKSCIQCAEGYYQPTENESQQCQVCTKCNKESESEVKSHCTTLANTVCSCRKGFLPREEDSSTCKCDIGSGKMMDGNAPECRECEDGFFSSSINSPCRAWTKCKENRVKFKGNKTSDADCHEPLDLPPVTTTPGLKTETTSLSTRHMFTHIYMPTYMPPEISTPTGLPHQKTTANHTPAAVNYRRNRVFVGVIVGFIVGLLILTAVAIRCKAKEGPEYKRPIKETQQAKLHEIDIQ